jgi:hypothetical protein
MIFACRKVLNDHRQFLDTHNVRDVQLTITMSAKGEAHVTTSHRTETMVMDCFETKRYVFTK